MEKNNTTLSCNLSCVAKLTYFKRRGRTEWPSLSWASLYDRGITKQSKAVTSNGAIRKRVTVTLIF